MNAIKITKADVGRKVKCADGTIGVVKTVYEFPHNTHRDGKMRVSLTGLDYIFHDDGKCPGLPSRSITAFVDGPLQLEAGKFYRTRDGRKAFVAGFSPFDGADTYRAAVGFIDGDAFEECWASSGQWGMNRNDKDLVAEWVEPKRIKGFVNLYDRRVYDDTAKDECPAYAGMGVHRCRANADAGAKRAEQEDGARRLACIEIDVLEGQGLEGEAGR